MDELADLVKAVSAPGILGPFALMAAAVRRFPDSRERINASFGVLCPTDPLRGKSDEAYRAHCKELLARVLTDGDLVPATDAECLCVLLDTSLKAPLNTTGCRLADVLFQRVFGRLPEGAPANPEPWPGACEDELRKMRARFSVKTRTVKKPE